MGGTSIWHWLILGIVVMLVFGRGRFSEMMGDVAKGIKSFKQGMSDDDTPSAATPPPARTTLIEGQSAPRATDADAAPHPRDTVR